MRSVTMKQARDQLPALTRLAQAGSSVVITRRGEPVANLVPHAPTRGGVNFAVFENLAKEKGLASLVISQADDFDDPLPEDFLLTPMT